MNDPILRDFLERQLVEGLTLARRSDILDLMPMGMPGAPPQLYWAHFRCRGLVRGADGVIAEASSFTVAIQFPPDYLRRVEPLSVVTVLDPPNVFHPNVNGVLLCPGWLTPGTSLVDVLHQVHAILTYAKVTVTERNALSRDACVWARNHLSRFPLDDRPLGRRLALTIDAAASPVRADATPASGGDA